MNDLKKLEVSAPLSAAELDAVVGGQNADRIGLGADTSTPGILRINYECGENVCSFYTSMP